MKPDRASRTMLAAAIAVTPLLLANGIFLSHDVLPKVIAVSIAAAWMLFTLSSWSGGITEVWHQPAGRRFLFLAGSQAVSLILSTVFSVQPMLSLAGTTWRRFGTEEQLAVLTIACAATSFAALSREWRASLLRAISLCGGIAAIYGIFQYFRIDPFLDPELYTIRIFGGVVRPPATMGHAIYFASWLAPVALIALAQANVDPDVSWRRVHAVISGLSVVAIFLSGTRGAVLGLAGGAIFYVARGGRLNRRIGWGAAAVIALMAVFAATPAGENLRHRLYQWREDLGGPRVAVWQDSLRMIGTHPVIGSGPETFAGEFRKIESVELSRAYPDFYNETPHNVFLDVAVAQGLPGFAILAALFLVGLSAPGPEGAADGLVPAIAAILICSLFASFSIVESLCLWTFCGLAVTRRAASSVKRPFPAWIKVPASLAGAALLAIACLLAVPDALNSQLADAVDAKNAVDANRLFHNAQAWSFGMSGNDLWRSREMAGLGRALGTTPAATEAWRSAAESAGTAETTSEERFNAAFQSSVIAITFGDLDRAEAKARTTIGEAPNWYKPHLLLAQILGAEGRNAEAVSEQSIAAGLTTKSSN